MQQTRTLVIRALIAIAIAHGAAAQAPTTVISPSPILQFWDLNGKPLAGGQVCVYAAGTTNPVTLYKDAAGTMQWGNPIVLDSSGRAVAYAPGVALKYVLRAKGSPNNCASGNTLYSVDNIQDSGLRLRSDLSAGGGAGMIGYTPPGGTVPGTIADALNAKMLDTGFATPAAACGAAQGTGKTLLVTKVWNAMPTQTCAANLEFATGGMFQPASGQTVTFSGVVAAAPIQIFDISSGGVLLFSNAATTVEAAWFGNAGGAFSAAVASLPAGGTLHIDPGFSSTVTTGATLSKASAVIRCEYGALLTLGFNGSLLAVTGARVHVTGCGLSGNRTANPTWAAPAILVGTASAMTPDVTIDGIALTDNLSTSSTTQNYGIRAINTPNLTVRNSRIVSNGGQLATDNAASPINVEATGAGNNSDNVRILDNTLENPSCPAGASCGNVIRIGKTDSSNATADNYTIQGNTIKNGARRVSIEIFSAGHIPGGNWPMIFGGKISLNHFIDEAPVSMDISLCLNSNPVVEGNDFNHGGAYPTTAMIELVNGSGRAVTGNTEFNCGQNSSGANIAVLTDGSGSGDVVASNSFPCGGRSWFIQAYPSETGRSNEIDKGNAYGCGYTGGSGAAVIGLLSGGEGTLPVTNVTIEGDTLVGTGCTGTVYGVALSSVGTAGGLNQSPLTGIKISGIVAIGITGGVSNGSYNGGTAQYTVSNNLWNPADANPPTLTLTSAGAGTGATIFAFGNQLSTAYQGQVQLRAGAGSATNSQLFTAAVGMTAYSGPPSCLVAAQQYGATAASNAYYDFNATGTNWNSTHTLYFVLAGGSPLVNGNNYFLAWTCTQN